MELAMACDIRIAADTAKMGLPEITLGLLPGYGGSQRLPRLVGKGMAKKMIFSGDMINAQEALRIGLVEEVAPASELMETVKTFAKKLASRSPIAMALCKRAVNKAMETTLQDGCFIEANLFGLAFSTNDMREGTSAFLEKRKPEFKGD
jgi:enoyl-CoA hydratase